MGHGKELRLFRVDRWDSGRYFCSTNATRRNKHEVELRVDTPPRVSAPGSSRDSNIVPVGSANPVTAKLGGSAVLKCKVC